jgi:N-acetylmuramoyl-L-alanine amidase
MELMQTMRLLAVRLTNPKKRAISPSMKITNHLLDDPQVRIGDSPNQGGTIKPTVIVLHYTASGGADGKGDASYLSRAVSRASAHVVVGRDGSIDQIIPFNKRAWHAGKSEHNGVSDVNEFSIGIEIDNWGWLKDGKSHTGEVVPQAFRFEGTRSGHTEWEAYREEQLKSVEEVIAAICDEYPITAIVGHEEIAPGRKQDPGPALDEFMQQMKEKYVGAAAVKKPTTTIKKPATPKVSKKGKTTTVALRLRKSPSPSATILTVMPEGAQVEVLSEWKGWTQLRFGNRMGYASSQYLT